MQKLTKKALKGVAKELAAMELSHGSTARYRDALHQIETMSLARCASKKAYEFVLAFPSGYHAISTQIAWSHGLYGETGSLDRVEIIDNETGMVDYTLFTYYTL